MLALTWWGWAGCGAAGLIAIVALLFGARRSWRASVRQELVDHLRRTAPELAITAIHPDRLELAVPGAVPDAGATFYLARLYQRIAELPAGDTPELRAGRAAVYDTIVATIRDGATGLAVARRRRRASQRDAATGHRPPPWRACAARSRRRQGAAVAAVRRGRPVDRVRAGLRGVRRLPDWRPARRAEAHPGRGARSSAAPTSPAPSAATWSGPRSASRDINVVKSCDSFDAARLLLVPGYLDAGESLVALIPDRDTLVLTAPPDDGDWDGLRKLARAADGDPLWAEPLIVTSAGIAKAA